ncbi:MAG TPA: STAS domain-containing protein [Azospira sp.]|nr:STAS domain-containing protein [Azospira sp.]
MHTQVSNVYRQGSDGHVAMQPRLDYSNTLVFHHSCNNLLTDASVHRLRLDCAQLTYIDSSGIGALMVVNDRATRDGKSLELLNCNNDVKKILKLVNLHKVIKIA